MTHVSQHPKVKRERQTHGSPWLVNPCAGWAGNGTWVKMMVWKVLPRSGIVESSAGSKQERFGDNTARSVAP